MTGWKIFSHSIEMISRNFQQAVQIFLVPLVLIALVIFAMVGQMASELTMHGNGASVPIGMVGPGVFLKFFLLSLVVALISMWGIVAWHRYVLLEEMPKGWIPRLNPSNIVMYLLRSLQLMLVSMVCMLPVAFIGSAIVQAGGVIGAVLMVVCLVAVSVFVGRMVLVLPAAAIGASFGLSDALRATQGQWPTFLAVGFFIFLANAVAAVILLGLSSVPWLMNVVQLGFSAVLSLLNISILTTLYGYYEEKRSI